MDEPNWAPGARCLGGLPKSLCLSVFLELLRSSDNQEASALVSLLSPSPFLALRPCQAHHSQAASYLPSQNIPCEACQGHLGPVSAGPLPTLPSTSPPAASAGQEGDGVKAQQ